MNSIIWGITLTLSMYLLIYIVQKKTNIKIINPLLISSILIIVIILIFKLDLKEYNDGTKFITFLIGPATVSLALPLYENIHLLKKHYKIIILTIFSGIIVHAVSIGILAVLLKLDNEMIATFVPKSVTTAIAKDISASLSGNVSITVVIVILTGILGSIIAPYIFKLFNVNNPLGRGLSLGISAHVVGTSKAVDYGVEDQALSTISLILTGIVTLILSPVIYNIIIYLA